MSRDQIKPLLSAIFPENGIVEWILRFDDYPHDLIRRLCPQNWEQGCNRCLRCGLIGAQRVGRIYEHMLSNDTPVTFCDNRHLEFPIGSGRYWSLSPNEDILLLSSGFPLREEYHSPAEIPQLIQQMEKEIILNQS